MVGIKVFKYKIPVLINDSMGLIPICIVMFYDNMVSNEMNENVINCGASLGRGRSLIFKLFSQCGFLKYNLRIQKGQIKYIKKI